MTINQLLNEFFSGLQDQLLALVIMAERPDLEEMRSAIVVGIAQMKGELKEIEDRILYKLSTSEGYIVDDIEFIITLESSKVKSEDIKVCTLQHHLLCRLPLIIDITVSSRVFNQT